MWFKPLHCSLRGVFPSPSDNNILSSTSTVCRSFTLQTLMHSEGTRSSESGGVHAGGAYNDDSLWRKRLSLDVLKHFQAIIPFKMMG